MTFGEVREMQSAQKNIVNEAVHNNLQGRIDLASHVERIVGGKEQGGNVNLKGVRETKQREKKERHRNFVEEVEDGESGNADACDADGEGTGGGDAVTSTI